VTIDNDTAIAIQDASARGENGYGLDAILLRPLIIELGILDLQFPETGDEEQEDSNGSILKNGDFAGRKTRIIARWRVVRDIDLVARVDRRQDHKAWSVCSLTIVPGLSTFSQRYPSGHVRERPEQRPEHEDRLPLYAQPDLPVRKVSLLRCVQRAEQSHHQ
jgi:hypothetical protein